jgi:hypothetical protein
MGNFYTNVTLRGPGQDRVVALLETERRRAYVSPVIDGCVVVFERNAMEMALDPDGFEEEDLAAWTGQAAPADLGATVTRALGGVALSVMVHDDDVLECHLSRDGEEVDRYNSTPGYFTSGRSAPQGGDAQVLCAAFDAPEGAVDRVEAILRAAHSTEKGGYLFEMDRHRDLTKALGLPGCAVATGYAYIARGEEPRGYDPSTWVKTGG